MKIYPIECGNFKLDGGAMFGLVPKSIWNKTNPADERNMIDLGTRALLIEDGNRLILIDCGLGNKQPDKFFEYYYLWGGFSLEGSLAKYGFAKEDITDVFLTHLHFDHCGGAVQWNKGRTFYETAFKNAKYWTNAAHWEWAINPNPREKASFLKENILPIQEGGQLNFIALPTEGNLLTDSPLGFDIMFIDGHTDKQMLPVFHYKGHKIVYIADLIPTAGHIPLIYVMGYDTRPLLTLTEKDSFLKDAAEHKYLIFFEHDAHNHLATVKHTERGVRLDQSFSFHEVFYE